MLPRDGEAKDIIWIDLPLGDSFHPMNAFDAPNNESADPVVMDAADFDRGDGAQARLPQRIPFGFHGNRVSDESVPPA